MGERLKMIVCKRNSLLILAAVMLMLAGCGKKTVKVKATDYISASFQGLNGEGRMTLAFDRDGLTGLIEEKKQMTEREKETLSTLLTDAEKDYILSAKDGLTNGDEIEITGGLEKDLLKDYGIVFDNDSVKVTVEGLADKLTLDLKEYIRCDYSGFDGTGTAYLYTDTQAMLDQIQEQAALLSDKPDQEKVRETFYACMESYLLSEPYFENLSNGDTVTSEISLDGEPLSKWGVEIPGSVFSEKVSGLAKVETIGIGKYLTINCAGYDTFGTARAALDLELMTEDIAKTLEEDERGFAGAATADTDYFADAERVAQILENLWHNRFETTLTKTETVSNGDEITVTVKSYDRGPEEAGEKDPAADAQFGCASADNCGYILEGAEKTLQVDGLPASVSIDMSPYLQAVFSGFDGDGEMSVTADEEKFNRDLTALIVQQDPSIESEDFLYDGSWLLSRAQNGLQVQEGLANGQELVLPVNLEETTLPEYGIYLEASDLKTTVSGLTEPQEIDLKDAMTVTFSGICPDVKVYKEINWDLPWIYQTNMSDLSGSEWLNAENGTVYEGVIEHDDEGLLSRGYIVKDDTFSYTVSGLDTWTIDLTDAADDRLSVYAAQAQSLLQEQFDRETNSISNSVAGDKGWVIWEDVTLQPEEIWFAKSTEEGNRENRLIFLEHIFVPMRNYDRSVTWKDMYGAAWISELRLTPAGSLVSDREMNTALYESKSDAEEVLQSDILYAMGEDADIVLLDGLDESQVPACESEGNGIANVQSELVREAVYGQLEWAVGDAAAMVQCDGHTYYRFDASDGNGMTWKKAMMACEKAGGHLATVTSKKEQDILQYLVSESYDGYWLGATDHVFEGSWQWITGEPFLWKNWNDGEPDNYYFTEAEGGEHYLSLQAGSSCSWSDRMNTEAYGFILELEPAREAEPVADGEAVCLADLETVCVNGLERVDYVTDSYGNTRFDSLAFDCSSRAVAEYDLQGGYGTFAFTLSTSDDIDSDSILEMMIWGDDRLLFSACDYTRADAPVPAVIDVSGISRLSVQTISRNGWGRLYLNDAQLFREKAADAKEQTDSSVLQNRYLSDLPVILLADAEDKTGNGIQTDHSGRVYRDALTLNAGAQGQAVIRLEQKAEYFLTTAAFVSLPGTDQEGVRVTFSGDGEELEQVVLKPYDPPKQIEIDVTGKQLLEVKASLISDENREQWIMLGDLCAQTQPEEAVQEPIMPEFPDLPAEVQAQAAATLTCGNTRYYRFDKAMTYQEAEKYCEAASASLAMPRTAEENAAITVLIKNGLWNNYNGYWIGSSRKNGFWYWEDGSAVQGYNSWYDGRPETDDSERYLMNIDVDGYWKSDTKESIRGFVMQVQAQSALVPFTGISLGVLEPDGAENAEQVSVKDTDAGTFYPDAIRLDAGSMGWMSWQLNGDYKAVSCVVSEGSQAEGFTRFAVFGDGKILYKTDDLRGTCAFMLDLTGIRELKIASSGYDGSGVCLCRSNLFPGQNTTQTVIDRISGLTVVDDGSEGFSPRLLVDSWGRLHDGRTAFNAGNGGYVLYNTNRQYQSMTVRFSSGSQTDAEAERTVRILLDGNVVYEEILTGLFGETDPIEVDMTNVSTLRFETESEWSSSDLIYVVDDQLVK